MRNLHFLEKLMEEAGINHSGLVKSSHRKTITKLRVLGGNQQMLRLDFEETGDLYPEEIVQLRQWLAKLLDEGLDGIIVSDYAKGVCSDDFCQWVISEGHAYNIPVLIDPKGADWTKYRGCDFITPNLKEMCEGEIISPVWIKATDPVTSLYGAFGKFLHDNGISLNEVERVMLTGVGAAYIDRPIYGLPTHRVGEFVADGLGAAFVSRLNRMIVVSMGTGTSLVSYDHGDIQHIGGIGIGGGTLNGLSRLLLQTDNIMQISEMALDGDVSNINLNIGDISAHPLPGLPMDATASLFANAQGNARREDIAKGLIGMVLQAIGSATILSSLNSGIRDYVLIGNLSQLPSTLPSP